MMKKTTLYITSIILLLLTLGACTHNNGDIGMWFGTWHVESITVAGTSVTVDGDCFFQFQSKVFRVSRVGDHEQMVESYGTWQENEDGSMTVTFPDPSVFYIQMTGLEENNHFTIDIKSSSEVQFTKTDSTGATVTYRLKKQP